MDRMAIWQACRTVGTALVIWGLAVPSPIAWAQLSAECQNWDPMLAAVYDGAQAGTEPLFTAEEAAIAEALIETSRTDPGTVAVVTETVKEIHAEGGVETVLSPEVLGSVRAQGATALATQEASAREALKTLPAGSEERKAMEAALNYGEQVRQAWEQGAAPPKPSDELVKFAMDQYTEWKEQATAFGVSELELRAAELCMKNFAEGNLFGGTEGVGPGGPPSEEQMRSMGMSETDIARAKEFMTHAGMEYGVGPGGSMPYEGAATFSHEAYASAMEAMYVSGGEFGQLAGGWEAMAGSAAHGAGFEAFMATGSMETAYAAGAAAAHEVITQQVGELVQQYQQTQTQNQAEQAQAHTLVSTHTLETDGHAEGHWDGNGDGIADHTHPPGTAPH